MFDLHGSENAGGGECQGPLYAFKLHQTRRIGGYNSNTSMQPMKALGGGSYKVTDLQGCGPAALVRPGHFSIGKLPTSGKMGQPAGKAFDLCLKGTLMLQSRPSPPPQGGEVAKGQVQHSDRTGEGPQLLLRHNPDGSQLGARRTEAALGAKLD